jgi:CRP-like cAMP-binding protein
VNLFELDASRRNGLLERCRRQRIARGEFAYTAGDRAADVWFVLEGGMKIVRTTLGGGEAIVGIRNPGDVFGELTSLLTRRPRTTSAVALENGELARLEAGAFERVLRADAELAAEFARGLAQRLTQAELELTERAGKSVPGRLVDALGRLAAEHGVAESDGTLRIGIRLTHKDLADLIGTSRETLTRELGILAEAGLLRIAQRTIVLLQPQAFPFNAKTARPETQGT